MVLHMSTQEHIEIDVDGMVFDALAAGPTDGELVLLLHGFPQTSHAWRAQLEQLADSGYRAVAPDQRGYSPGARPSETEAYRSEHLYGDVLAMVDRLGADRFHLVGHDWGGAVAWQVAGRSPERLRTLTVVSTPHPAAFSRALSQPDQQQRSGYMELFRQEGAEDGMLANEATGLRMIYAASGLTEAEAAPYLKALGTPEALGAALNWYRAADITLVEGLGSIKTPTLYVWSTDDAALGREAAEATGQFVDGPYRFVILEGVDHWIPEHAADQLGLVLMEHIGERRS